MKPQSILFGNGLNLIGNKNPSWEQLLKTISKEKLDDAIPNTLKYEAIILSNPYKGTPEKLITADGKSLNDSKGYPLFVSTIVEEALKKDIATQLQKFVPNEAYALMAALPVEHFLTTNYDNTLFKVEKAPFVVDKKFRQEQLYSIRRHYVLESSDQIKQYWPIHGNVDSPKSIMLGYDHYSGSLSKIENYIKGKYEMPGYGIMESITKRLEVGVSKIYSWIDLFFMTDVHIIGQGLDYAEMDLWWILNKRSRIKQRNSRLIKNRVIFYPDYAIPNHKRQMLKGFDVEICDLKEYPKNKLSLIIRKQLKNMQFKMEDWK